MEKAKIFTRTIETNSPLGDFYIKIELEGGIDDEGQVATKVASYRDIKHTEVVISTVCENDLNSIMKTIQDVSQSHTQALMEEEREDITKFFINRGFKPEYPRFSV